MARVSRSAAWRSRTSWRFAVNLAWPVFFALQKLRLALLMNFGLTASLVVLIGQYAAIDTPAALLLPAWLLFATALNDAICKLNPEDGYNFVPTS